MRILLTALAFVFVCLAAGAQEFTQTVRGRIVDEDSKLPLIGATIIHLNSDPINGTSTDIDGKFELKGIPIGRHSFQVKYLGYEMATIPEVLITTGKEVVLDIGLTESVTEIKEVVVTAKRDPASAVNDMAVVSTRSITIEQTNRFAASANDPARLALSFAGVTSNNDINNEIIVRGNAPKGVLWRMEGLEIPAPSHFRIEGLNAGNISLLSSTVLDDSDFSTGAFPAEYGNALSAVYDLHLRNGNNVKREYTFQVGLLGVEAAAEGPFKKGKKSSYLINYRYSTLRIFQGLGLKLEGDLITGFQDLNMKLNFPTQKHGTFGVFAVAGLSDADIPAVMDSSKWVDTDDWDQDRVDERYRNHYLVAGLTNDYIINEHFRVSSRLAFTSYGNNISHQYLTDSLKFIEYWRFKLSNSAIKASVEVNTKLNAKHHLRYGVNYSHLIFRLSDWEYWDDDYRAVGETDYIQSYIQHRWRFNMKWQLLTGVHLNYFRLNHNYAIEPRLALVYRPNNRHKIGFASGLHSRAENLAFYLVQDPSNLSYVNREVDFSRAQHLVLSHDWRVHRDVNIKTEAYFQYLFEIPVRTTGSYSSLNDDFAYTRRPLNNSGDGVNYGLELTVEKFFNKNYYVLLTGSLYDSRYRAADDEWRNTRYNGNYAASLTGGKDFYFGKQKQYSIGINSKILFAGGQRLTPIDLAASVEEGTTVRDDSRRYEGRADNYFRIDAMINFRHNLRKFAWVISIDVQNATNRKNELKRKYDNNKQQIVKRTQQGIIPVLKLRFDI